MENLTLLSKDGFTFRGSSSSSSPKLLVWAFGSVEEWTRKGFLKQDRLDMKQGKMGQDKTEQDKNERST
jgi:hypothetical protein